MNEQTIKNIYLLKSVIEKDDRFKQFRQLEGDLAGNLDVLRLNSELDQLIIKYEDALDFFGEESQEAKELTHQIYLKKLELDSLEVSKKYTEKFIEVRDIYSKLNKKIFSPFKEAKGFCKK